MPYQRFELLGFHAFTFALCYLGGVIALLGLGLRMGLIRPEFIGLMP